MRELDIDEVKKIQLEVLQRTAEFCDHHDITYFLAAGTMLGAIRHKGFIPWDDDIDISIPRPDFERLLKIFNVDHLELNYPDRCANYYYPFLKISDNRTYLKEEYTSEMNLGVHIDVFPLDGFPEETNLREEHLKKMKSFRKPILFKAFKFGPTMSNYKRIILSVVKFFIPIKYYIKKTIATAKIYKFESSPNAGIVVWGYGNREICPFTVFEGSVIVEFEKKKFKAPVGYKEYLETVYGNYMELPPKEEQKPKHHFKAYYK